MQSVSRIVPWLLVVALGVLLGATWNASRHKDDQISSLISQYQNLVTATNAKYKQLADEANSKIALANQREVSVRVSFRKALLNSGLVAVISNTSGKTIAVTADIARPSTDQRKSAALTIDGGAVAEIGQKEGWAFVSGDTIVVSQPDHKALTFTAP